MVQRKRHGMSSSHCGALALLLLALCQTPFIWAGEVKQFTVVNLLINGTKVWLPSQITVQTGDDVVLTLNNTLTAPHGFTLAAFDVAVEVPAKHKKVVRFTATEAGIYPFWCQLHAAHIGGQLVVLNKYPEMHREESASWNAP